jgi:hypothetical protein
MKAKNKFNDKLAREVERVSMRGSVAASNMSALNSIRNSNFNISILNTA